MARRRAHRLRRRRAVIAPPRTRNDWVWTIGIVFIYLVAAVLISYAVYLFLP